MRCVFRGFLQHLGSILSGLVSSRHCTSLRSSSSAFAISKSLARKNLNYQSERLNVAAMKAAYQREIARVLLRTVRHSTFELLGVKPLKEECELNRSCTEYENPSRSGGAAKQ